MKKSFFETWKSVKGGASELPIYGFAVDLDETLVQHAQLFYEPECEHETAAERRHRERNLKLWSVLRDAHHRIFQFTFGRLEAALADREKFGFEEGMRHCALELEPEE